jgi:hypothetical protein
VKRLTGTSIPLSTIWRSHWLFSTTAELRSEVAGSRIRTWHLMPTDRMGPPPGASPPMRMTASWSGSTDPTAYKSVARRCAPMASSPRILNRPTGTNQTPRYAKSPSRSSSSLRVLRRQGAAKHKLARRQAAKLCYRFGPLTPSARSANLIAGDGTKNGFPAPNKEPATNQKYDLTGKAPYRFESTFLRRRVCEPSVPQRRSPLLRTAQMPPRRKRPARG